jgi:molybdopterin-binding protein
VNKKKQKNFSTRDNACGDDSATCKHQRKKSFHPGTTLVAPAAPQATAPEEQKFFGSFFQKRTASLCFPDIRGVPRCANAREDFATSQQEEFELKISARNQIKGKVAAVQKGQTTGHVRIDIGNGVILTASITNEAIDELALAAGDDAFAIIKASDVMVGK